MWITTLLLLGKKMLIVGKVILIGGEVILVQGEVGVDNEMYDSMRCSVVDDNVCFRLMWLAGS